MPSRITPTFWNSDDSDHMIQPVIAFSRSVSAEAAAMAPIVAAPCVHRTIAVPMTATIRKPLISVSPRSIQRDDPHLRHEGPARVLDRLAGVGLLGAGVGEELHRLDVGVAVDHPPGDRRARVREGLRRPPDPRDRPGDEPDVEAEPDDERHAEPPVGVRTASTARRRGRSRHRRARRRSGRSPRRRPAPSASAGWRCARRSRSGTSRPTGAARGGASASGRSSRRSASATG